MSKGYDSIANYYDLFARLVFGKAIAHAQEQGLSAIAPSSRLLIVGGGTGYVLEYLSTLQIADLKIDYVEASESMIELAQYRMPGNKGISWIQASFEEIHVDNDYDVIITQFFLDSYQGAGLVTIISQLHAHLKAGGTWILADFQKSVGWRKIWQKSLLSIMYLFFSITVGIKARRLEDFHRHLLRLGYQLRTSQSFFGDFIFSSTYQKSS